MSEDERVERVKKILDWPTTEDDLTINEYVKFLKDHMPIRIDPNRLPSFDEVSREVIAEFFAVALDKELSRFNPTGILNESGIAIAEFGEVLDESRRRRETGEPSNVKVTAWEVLPDGERVEIVNDKYRETIVEECIAAAYDELSAEFVKGRIERGCGACGKPWTNEELKSKLPVFGISCHRCAGHEG